MRQPCASVPCRHACSLGSRSVLASLRPRASASGRPKTTDSQPTPPPNAAVLGRCRAPTTTRQRRKTSPSSPGSGDVRAVMGVAEETDRRGPWSARPTSPLPHGRTRPPTLASAPRFEAGEAKCPHSPIFPTPRSTRSWPASAAFARVSNADRRARRCQRHHAARRSSHAQCRAAARDPVEGGRSKLWISLPFTEQNLNMRRAARRVPALERVENA
jgi:hypothetical protein